MVPATFSKITAAPNKALPTIIENPIISAPSSKMIGSNTAFQKVTGGV